MSDSPVTPLWTTLFSAYAPVERYLQTLARSGSGAAQPDLALSALDCYLMGQIAACYPAPPTVIDLAADATAGATTALWSSQPTVRRVLAPRLGGAAECSGAWRGLFPSLVDEAAQRRASLNGDVRLDDAAALHALQPDLAPFSPVIFTLAGSDAAPAAAVAHLRRLFQLQPDGLVLLLPLGRIGQSALLEAVLADCRAAGRRLDALREVNPFLSSSQLGLVSSPTTPSIEALVRQLGRPFEGNFEFLTLLQALLQATQREQQALQDVAVARQEAKAFENSLREWYNRPLRAEVMHVLLRVTPRPLKQAVKALRKPATAK